MGVSEVAAEGSEDRGVIPKQGGVEAMVTVQDGPRDEAPEDRDADIDIDGIWPTVDDEEGDSFDVVLAFSFREFGGEGLLGVLLEVVGFDGEGDVIGRDLEAPGVRQEGVAQVL